MKWIKFGISKHFLENPLRKWPEILHDLGFPDILVMLCGFASWWYSFDWNWSYLGFLGIIWRTCGSTCQGGSGGIFPTLCIEFCLVVFLAWISALWWPNIWPKIGFQEPFERSISSIHSGIYPHGVSPLTPIPLPVPSLNFCPLIPKYLAKMGFFNFLKKIFAHFYSFLVSLFKNYLFLYTTNI